MTAIVVRPTTHQAIRARTSDHLVGKRQGRRERSTASSVRGTTAVTVVPVRSRDATSTVPPTASRRSRMLARPAPDAAAACVWSKPVPSSVTVSRHRYGSSSTRTDTVPAPECLAAFCTASMQQK